jgi:hypothetical protein
MIGAGFALWLAGTILFRAVGQHLFVEDERLLPVFLLAFFGNLPLGFGLLYFFKARAEAERHRVLVTALPLPLFLDGLTLAFFEDIFPNMTPDRAQWVAAWLFIAYCATIIPAAFFRPRA